MQKNIQSLCKVHILQLSQLKRMLLTAKFPKSKWSQWNEHCCVQTKTMDYVECRWLLLLVNCSSPQLSELDGCVWSSDLAPGGRGWLDVVVRPALAVSGVWRPASVTIKSQFSGEVHSLWQFFFLRLELTFSTRSVCNVICLALGVYKINTWIHEYTIIHTVNVY